MFRHDAVHTGANNSAKLSLPLKQLWSRRVFEGGLVEASVASGYVCVASKMRYGPVYFTGVLACLNEVTGDIAWADTLPNVNYTAQPTIGHGALFEQVSDDGSSAIVAYDLTTGGIDWYYQYSTQAVCERGPTLHNDLLVFSGGTYGGVFGISAIDGAEFWFHRLTMTEWWAASVWRDTIYTYISGYLQARHAATGELIFAISTLDQSKAAGRPQNEAVAFDWMGTAPVIDTISSLAFLMWHEQFDAVDLSTREVLWHHEGDYAIPGNVPCPVLYDGKIYALESHRLVCYDGATGAELWDCRADEVFINSPVAADGHIFVSSATTTYAVDITSHTIVWFVSHGGQMTIANDILYIASDDGTLYAFASDPTDVEDPTAAEALPTYYSLSQNHPNPFNPSTVISYALPQKSHVELAIYNILGQEVITLIDTDKPAGEYEATWTGRDTRGKPVSSGVYFYRLKASDFVSSRKMLLLK
jgi:hypothetical protein